MKFLENMKIKMLALSMAAMSFMTTPVYAEGIGNGTLPEVTEAFRDVFAKIGPLVNGGINLAGVGLGIFAVIRGCFGYYQYFTEDNPNEKKAKLKSANFSMFGAAIAVCITLIINVFLGALGIGVFQLS